MQSNDVDWLWVASVRTYGPSLLMYEIWEFLVCCTLNPLAAWSVNQLDAGRGVFVTGAKFIYQEKWGERDSRVVS